ncbi:S41 family peptidase (plasmid) [Halorussus limi]|uniref:S41 family peptidase n=1 Tax=Halorussus limi TaxID=2938695 RepID=A0A8U0HZ81_9EURY|nr:S41 family peptidase [Halorussus limi]UPV76340.1 S41 family peptidase [Halorussus limi]
MGDEPTHYPRADLVEDARSLATTLEASHPDPYAGHGGRVAFHRNLEELVREIPADGESLEAFYERVAEFAALVRDLHTAVSPPEETEAEVAGRLPLGFRVVGDGLYVDEVYDEDCADLLGGRLVAAEGVPTADLEARAAAVESADNEYGDRRNLGKMLEAVAPLRFLLDDEREPERPTLTVETPDGERTERTLEVVETDEPVETLATSVERPETDGEPAFRFLDDERSTALLALPDMRLYREHPEMMTAMDAEGSERMARDAYREVVGEPVPDELTDVLAGIPSATEVLTELVEEMADAGTETLVVDTRDNGGGNSALTYILLYVLYGWDGIADATADQISVPKDSDLYRQRFGDEGAVGETDNPAGFDFESYFARGDADEQLDQLREQVRLTETFREEVESGDNEAYYRPESVVVVTSAGTASAGTEPAFLLSKLGASVVGVPSVQAPNKPRDLLPGELPNTGLDFRVSFRHVEFRPEADDGDVFVPEAELTSDRFEAYDRAGDAGLRLALDFAGADDDSESNA